MVAAGAGVAVVVAVGAAGGYVVRWLGLLPAGVPAVVWLVLVVLSAVGVGGWLSCCGAAGALLVVLLWLFAGCPCVGLMIGGCRAVAVVWLWSGCSLAVGVRAAVAFAAGCCAGCARGGCCCWLAVVGRLVLWCWLLLSLSCCAGCRWCWFSFSVFRFRFAGAGCWLSVLFFSFAFYIFIFDFIFRLRRNISKEVIKS